MSKAEFVKIQFYEPDVGYENLWAADLGKSRYQIESIPFFVYGISVGDIVEATSTKDGKLRFVKVITSGGNRTLRARSDEFERHPEERKKLISALRRRKCAAEELPPNLIAIDVPESIDLDKITHYLTDLTGVSWEYANPEELNDSD